MPKLSAAEKEAQARELVRDLPPMDSDALHDFSNGELLTFVENWTRAAKFALNNLRDEETTLRVTSSCLSALKLAVKKLEDRTGKSFGPKNVQSEEASKEAIREIHALTTRVLNGAQNAGA